jgi:hypothetical protein
MLECVLRETNSAFSHSLIRLNGNHFPSTRISVQRRAISISQSHQVEDGIIDQPANSKCPVVYDVPILDQCEIVAVTVASADRSSGIGSAPITDYLTPKPSRDFNSRVATSETIAAALKCPSAFFIVILFLVA